MIKSSTRNFRVTFARMADQSIVTRTKLAELLATTPGTLTQRSIAGSSRPRPLCRSAAHAGTLETSVLGWMQLLRPGRLSQSRPHKAKSGVVVLGLRVWER